MSKRLPHFLSSARTSVLLKAARTYGATNARVLLTAAASGAMTPLRMWESIRFAKRAESVELHSQPVFIVGHWQSGHSLLHNLLACDPQFATVRLKHAISPASFNVTGGFLRRFVEPRLPQDRGVDSLPGGLDSPQGDDFMLAGLTPLSWYYAYVFPEAAEQVLKRSLFFDQVSDDEITAWQSTYLTALRRVAAEQGTSRILSRNAANSCRIPQLLQMFPEAKFIHVHRHPDEVFSAQRDRWFALTQIWSMQEVPLHRFRHYSLDFYRRMMKKYLEDRELLESGQLAEVRHDDLVHNPVSTAQRVYDELGLGDFEGVKPEFEKHSETRTGSLAGDEDTTEEDRQTVRDRWRFAFDEFGYTDVARLRVFA